jgi:hypothetical protein
MQDKWEASNLACKRADDVNQLIQNTGMDRLAVSSESRTLKKQWDCILVNKIQHNIYSIILPLNTQ